MKQYEIDMEAMERKQKREIEDAEKLQEEEMKQAQKRLKYEQVVLTCEEIFRVRCLISPALTQRAVFL